MGPSFLNLFSYRSTLGLDVYVPKAHGYYMEIGLLGLPQNIFVNYTYKTITIGVHNYSALTQNKSHSMRMVQKECHDTILSAVEEQVYMYMCSLRTRSVQDSLF